MNTPNNRVSACEPRIALGTWSWGTGFAGGDQVFGNHLGAPELESVFNEAMNSGLNLWDSAVVYGMGASEDVLATFTKERKREDVIIYTKFTPQIADETAENPVAAMLESSLNCFGTDYIDMYWIHNPADVERWTPYLIDLVKSNADNHHSRPYPLRLRLSIYARHRTDRQSEPYERPILSRRGA